MADKKPSPVSVDPLPEVVKAAKAVRVRASQMTDTQRDDAFRRGMQLIYGGTGGIAAKTGRP